MFAWLKHLGRDQRGITGLETAIILIAFVVVASVFAYTVLSAGIFSAEKGKEAIHAGLEQARSSVELVGGVKATGVAATTINNVEDNWTASANVTSSLDSTDRRQGSNSVQLAIGAAFATGLVAYDDLAAPVDVSSHYSVRFWIKTNTDLNANVLRLVLDDTAGCGSPLETLDIPALTAANGWTRVQLKFSNPSALTAVACVGINAASDPGTVTIKVDHIEAPGEVTKLHLVLSNSLGGEPIDLTTTTDSNSDGLLSDEANPNHVLTIAYVDSDQRVNDLAWTRTELGKGDGDALLEAGEKMQITIELKALDPMPVDYTLFVIHLKPGKGSTLSVERTVPSVVKASMDLN